MTKLQQYQTQLLARVQRTNPLAKVKTLPNGAIRVLDNKKRTAYDRGMSKVVNKCLDQRMTTFNRGRVCYKYKSEGLRNVK